MMMGMMGMMLVWLLGLLLCIVLVAVAIWLLVGWLSTKQTPQVPYAARPQDASYPYERGYQPTPDTDQEGGRQFSYHQPRPKQEHEQPQAQYPQEQELPQQ
jgi:hypothetical protein